MPEVAEAVARRLVPNADFITPNVWELARLTGREIATAGDAIDAVRRLRAPAPRTSPAGGPRPGHRGAGATRRDRPALYRRRSGGAVRPSQAAVGLQRHGRPGRRQ